MKIAVRTDASFKIGTGHVMRCLSLVEELRRKGAEIWFVCREHAGHLCNEIASKGFGVVRLGIENDIEVEDEGLQDHSKSSEAPVHSEWLGVDQSIDAKQTMLALKEESYWDWLIVDHYALDARWESVLRSIAERIMVIDDLADRPHNCDLILDQNYFEESEKRYNGLLPDYCATLMGPKYALVRSEFRQARNFTRMRGNGIARIVVYLGGNDPDNITGKALEALSSPELNHLYVEVVIRHENPNLRKLQQQVESRPGTRLHVQPAGFIELLLRADLCIGAGGTTTWERLCLGLPSIVITVATNQEPFTAELDRANYVKWLGRKEEVGVEDIKKSVIREIKELEKNSPSELFDVVDGYGALRVVNMLTVK